MVARIFLWIRLLFIRVFSKEPLFTNKYVNMIPDQLRPSIVYIEGDGQKDQFASLLCPCGCNEEINLNLEPDEEPCWRINPGLLSDVSPSIWKQNNCKSHFFLKKGRIRWCDN